MLAPAKNYSLRSYLFGLVLLAAVGGPNPVSGEPSEGGDLPTVAAVQGNEVDADLASRFLTGCRLDCQSPAVAPTCPCFKTSLHAPSDWPSVHLHLNFSLYNYTKFYTDQTVLDALGQHGLDQSSPNGLEGQRLLFYAGEGSPTSLEAFHQKPVALGDFSLGDGRVRYLWMVTCNLFAHGPEKAVGGQVPDNVEPDSFQASLGETKQQNVFHRWARDYGGGRRPLNPKLRLACGGSSRIGGFDAPHRIWHYFSQLGLGPTESFLLGLYKPESGEIPLCISQGAIQPETSGLYDARLEGVPLTISGDHYVYIEYPIAAREPNALIAKAKSKGLRVASEPESPNSEAPAVPILQVSETLTPAFLRALDFDGKAHVLDYGFRGGPAEALGPALDFLSDANFSSADVCAKRQSGSGAIVISWRPAVSSLVGTDVSQAKAVTLLDRFLAQVPGVNDGPIVFRVARPLETKVDSVPEDQAASGSIAAVAPSSKCFYLRLTTAYLAPNGTEVPILGEGGEALLAICPRRPGASAHPAEVCRREVTPLLTFSYANRRFKDTQNANQKRFERDATTDENEKSVREEALAQLAATGRPMEAYNLVRWRWGYRAAPMHCKQSEMYLVYEVDFAPKPDDRFRSLPPVTVEVPAHPLKNGKTRIEDTWVCDPEKPPG